MSHKKPSAANAVHAASEKAQDVGKGVSEAMDSVKSAAARVQEGASQQFEEWSDTASEFVDERLDQLREWESSLVQNIREKPLTTLLCVAAGAFVLGALWRR